MDKINFTAYNVGDKILPPGHDEIRFGTSSDGGPCSLVLKMRDITAAEKRAFKSVISIRFAQVEGIIFLLCRMGTLQWMDAPYYKWLYPTPPHLESPEDELGIAIHAMLVEANTGVLVAQKLVSLSTALSRWLVKAIDEQPQIPDYDRALQSVYARYSTDDLLESAVDIR